MTYSEWEAQVPTVIKDDSVWRVRAYRLGLFLADLAEEDVGKLFRDRRGAIVADQLLRAASYISSNVTEGYSRGTGKGRAQFYEYALGSARESRDWYYKSRRVLGETVTAHRLDLTAEITRLLISMVARERRTNRKIVPQP